MRDSLRFNNYQIVKKNRAPKLRHEFFTFGARETCFVRDEIWMRWLLEHGVKALISLPTKDNYEYYIETASSIRLFRALARKMAVRWGRHVREYSRKKQALIRAAEELGRVVLPPHPNPLPPRGEGESRNRQVVERYERYLGAAYEFGDYIWGAWAVIYAVEPYLLKRLSTSPDPSLIRRGSAALPLRKGELERVDLEAITALDQPIEYMKMRRDLFRLSPPQWVKRYGWIAMYNPYDAPYAARDYARMKRELTRREAIRQFAQFGKNRARFRTLLHAVRDPKLRRYCEMAHAYAFLKTDRIDAWQQTMLALRPFYAFVASLASQRSHATKHDSAGERVKFSLRDACNLTAGEIMQLIFPSPQPSPSRGEGVGWPSLREMRLRSQNQALYYLHDRTIEIVNGARAIAKVQAQIEGVQKSETTLSGIVACKGRARGRAVVVTHTRHLKKVRKGDIFIAKFTFPSFTPYMRKAAGVVTDDGGITAHAAVISREYGIPCIIGTNAATKVFRDGDWVEVDAARGVVRVIKSVR